MKKILSLTTLNYTSKVIKFALFSLFIALIFVAPSNAASLEKVKEKGVLEIAMYKNFPPYSYVEKGVQVGIDVDIAKELASRLSLAANIRMVGADENVEDDLRNNIWKGHYLGGGTADVMFHMPFDRQFSSMVDQVEFISPYQLEKLVFAFDTKKVGEQPTVANFMYESIGVELDTLSDFYLLRAMNGKITPQVRHYLKISAAIADLKKGNISAVMGPRGEIEGSLFESNPANIVVQSLVTPGLGNSSWAMGLAVKKSYSALATELNAAMAEMSNDGTISAIFKRYKVTHFSPAKAPK